MNEPYPQNLESLLGSIHKLPSLPAVAMDILASFDDENLDVPTLSSKIARDQAIVVRVMRVANSAFFGLSGQVATIPEAVAVLGFNNLRSLVVAAAMIDTFPHFDKLCDGLPFWHHSLGAAVCAKVLARHQGCPPESAFLAGLLHDIGWLVMVTYLPESYAEVHATEASSVEQMLAEERRVFGFDHAMLGSAVVQRWHLPETIVAAVRHHHAPMDAAGQSAAIIAVTYVANMVATTSGNQFSEETVGPQAVVAATATLGLDQPALAAQLPEMQRLYSGAVMLGSA